MWVNTTSGSITELLKCIPINQKDEGLRYKKKKKNHSDKKMIHDTHIIKFAYMSHATQQLKMQFG